MGHAVIITTRSLLSGEIRDMDIRKESCDSRAGNFDSEVRAIRKAVAWSQYNRVQRVLIRSDSTAAIQRVKDMRLGPGQEQTLKIKKRMEKMMKKVHIEWIKGYSGDEGNEIVDQEAKAVRTKS